MRGRMLESLVDEGRRDWTKIFMSPLSSSFVLGAPLWIWGGMATQKEQALMGFNLTYIGSVSWRERGWVNSKTRRKELFWQNRWFPGKTGGSPACSSSVFYKQPPGAHPTRGSWE